ncbi:RPAP1-like protein, partial [Thamnocephalis sphaerospora]
MQAATHSTTGARDNRAVSSGAQVHVRPRDLADSEEDLLAMQNAFFRDQVKPAARVTRAPPPVTVSAATAAKGPENDGIAAAAADDNDEEPPALLSTVAPMPAAEAALPTVSQPVVANNPMIASATGGARPKRGRSLFAQRQAALLARVHQVSGGDDELDSERRSIETVPQPINHQENTLLAEVRERDDAATSTVTPPQVVQRSTITGFPEPERLPVRTRRVRFEEETPTASGAYAEVDRQNREQIATMTEDELEEAHAELLTRLGEQGIEKLLARLQQRNTQEHQNQFNAALAHQEPRGPSTMFRGGLSKSAAETSEQGQSATATAAAVGDVDNVPMEAASSRKAKDVEAAQPQQTMTQDDDPIVMRQRYFENAALEPEKLAWMGIELDESAPGGLRIAGERRTADSQDERDNGSESSGAAIRYDLRGQSVPADAELPAHHGLHHHGKEQERAGYTIEELLMLARSAVPAQRATAWRILARVLWHARNTSVETTTATCAADPASARFAELSGPYYLVLGLEETHASVLANV